MCLCVTAAHTVSFHLLYMGENYVASSYDTHNTGERGQNRKVLSYRHVILSVWSKGWAGSSHIAPVVSGALDNSMIAVIHWCW